MSGRTRKARFSAQRAPQVAMAASIRLPAGEDDCDALIQAIVEARLDADNDELQEQRERRAA